MIMSFVGSTSSLASRASSVSDKRTVTTCFCNVDSTTRIGRRIQAFQLVAFPTTPALILAIYLFAYLSVHTVEWLHLIAVSNDVEMARDLLEIVTSLQRERLASVSSAFEIGGNLTLTMTYAEASVHSNAAIFSISQWPSTFVEPYLATRGCLVEYLSVQRENFRRGNTTLDDRLSFYWEVITSLVTGLPVGTETEVVYTHLFAYQALAKSWDAFELQRILGLQYFSFGNLSLVNSIYFIGNSSLSQDLFLRGFSCSRHLETLYRMHFKDNSLRSRFNEMTSQILHNTNPAPVIENPLMWNQMCDEYVERFQILKNRILDDILDISLDPKLNEQVIWVAVYVTLFVIVIAICVFVIHNAYHTTKSIHATVSTFTNRVIELRKEKRKTEHLLAEMLPKTIAKQLRQGFDVRAEQFDCATIYFSDIADFTDISSESQPMQIVSLLNNVYNFLDSKIELYDVYKVETIGSVYMTVSGVPLRNKERHASEIAMMSIDILEATEDFVIPHMPSRGLQLRIGAHTGKKSSHPLRDLAIALSEIYHIPLRDLTIPL